MQLPGGPFRDAVVAFAVVGGVLAGLFLYTGVWPPMVVVESGSMMHPTCEATPEPGCAGYGKFGSIDPGDMVFVKSAPRREDVVTFAEAAAAEPGQRNYGKPGDVVVYFRDNARERTPIIHRALTFVEVQGVSDAQACASTGEPGKDATYTLLWEGQQRTFRAAEGGIDLSSLGFTASGGRGYNPCWSGFITKGDNPVTNTLPDQATGGGVLPTQPVPIAWVQGKAVGEIPWFGLIKLALGSTTNYFCTTPTGAPTFRSGDPACDDGKAVRILNAFAPADLWVMLGVSLALIAGAPVAYDVCVLRRTKEAAAPAKTKEEEK